MIRQAGSSYDIPKKLQEVFGSLRAADEIIDEGHIIGKVTQLFLFFRQYAYNQTETNIPVRDVTTFEGDGLKSLY